MYARFGPTEFEDFFGDLTKLRQTTSVRDYQTQFEKLLTRAEKLTPAQQVGCFISGLRESIRVEVQAARPSSLTTAVGLARLYEAKVTTKRLSVMKTRRTVTPSLEGSRPAFPSIKKFTPIEIEERRNSQKGLCFHCDEKFGPRHVCKKLFILEASYPEESTTMNPTTETENDVDMEIVDEAPAI